MLKVKFHEKNLAKQLVLIFGIAKWSGKYTDLNAAVYKSTLSKFSETKQYL